MAVKKARRLEIAQRRRDVAELYIQGWTQTAIAEKLGIGQPAVCKDLQQIQREWRDSRIRDFDAARELELQKIDRLEREAWAAWERSQKPSQSAEFAGDANNTPKRKRVTNRVGDPRYLLIVHNCIASRRAVLGLDALPALPKDDPNDNPTDRASRIVSLVTQIRDRERIAVARTTTLTIESGSVCPDGVGREVEDGEAPRLPGPGDP